MQKNTCIPVFIAALFTYTMGYFSGIEKNEMPSAATWMDLEISILSEVRQRQISYDLTYMWNLEKKKMKMNLLQNKDRLTDLEHKFVATRGKDKGEE